MSRRAWRDPVALRRQLQDGEAVLSEPPHTNDTVAAKRWGIAFLNVSQALLELGRFQEVADRTAEAEPTLRSFDSLELVWLHTRAVHAAALLALERYDEALEMADAVLAVPLDVQEKGTHKMTGATRSGQRGSDLASIMRSTSGMTLTNASSGASALLKIGQLAVKTRLTTLEALGRFDEAYAAARQLTASALYMGDADRVGHGLRAQARIAYRQHRYDRVLISVLRVAQGRSDSAIAQARAQLTKRVGAKRNASGT